ncbi:MAG: SH3 domain-containing protein [Clostridia bacterium]|nr:SH3 domain-containing protein [Clostridia bacterium]
MNNRKSSRILPALLAATLALTPLAASASEYATVKGGGLNLREKASLEAKVLGQYWTGTWIEIVEKGDEWCKVKVNGKEGYMMTKYLNTGTAGATLYVRTNTGIGLNLRAAPSLDAEIITSFPIDTAVTVVQRGAAWHKVKVSEQEGYMSSKYLVASKAPAYTTPLSSPVTATMKNINGGSVVNFRLYPGMNTKIIKAYPVGTQVTVLEKGVNWSKVEINGQQGYVSTYMLKF